MFGLFKKKEKHNKIVDKEKEEYVFNNFCRIVDSCVTADQLRQLKNYVYYSIRLNMYSHNHRIKMINYLIDKTKELSNKTD